MRLTYDGNGSRVALEAWVKSPGNGSPPDWEKEPPGLSVVKQVTGAHRPGGPVNPPGLGVATPGGPRKGAAGELTLDLRYVTDPLDRTSRLLAAYDLEGLRSAYVCPSRALRRPKALVTFSATATGAPFAAALSPVVAAAPPMAPPSGRFPAGLPLLAGGRLPEAGEDGRMTVVRL